MRIDSKHPIRRFCDSRRLRDEDSVLTTVRGNFEMLKFKLKASDDSGDD